MGKGNLDFRYVDRELDCLRRAPGMKLDDGTPATKALVLDLLLANARDGRPIFAELKTRGDKDAFYALIQVLAAAAHLTTPAQRERLLHLYRPSLGSAASDPRIDLYVILYDRGESPADIALLERAMQVAAAVSSEVQIAQVVRKIAFIDARLEHGRLRLEVVRRPDTKRGAATALAEQFRASTSEVRLDPKGYVSRLEENLLPGLSASNVERLRDEFGAGKGGELAGGQPKLHAVHSSAALAVNCLARWRERPEDLVRLELAGQRGFQQLTFEHACPTGLKGTPPHLDALASSGDHIVALESKLLEFLTPRPAIFSPAYAQLVEAIAHPTWRAAFQRLVAAAHAFRYLDAAQLVKHYLGLKKTFPDHEVTLLYAYWEPEGAVDDPLFAAHRAEVAAFAAGVDDPSVRFLGESYGAIWGRWAKRKRPDWARDHVTNLRRRYYISIRTLRAGPAPPLESHSSS